MALIIGVGGKSAGKAGASSYVVAWDGESTPVVSEIPAGVTVTYGGTSYTGTLAASKEEAGKIYLVSDGTGDTYYRYVVSKDGDSYSWVPLGSTEIDLSDYATKESVSELSEEVEKKANKDGYYGGMTVGSAENLVGRGTVEAEYAGVRTSAGTADIGSGSAAIARMKGKSFVWNQLVQNGDFSYGEQGWNSNGTITVSDNVATISGTDTNQITAASYPIVENHKFVGFAEVKPTASLTLTYRFVESLVGITISDTNNWTRISQIGVASSTGATKRVTFFESPVGVSWSIKNIVLFDLTLLFGAGNEPSTVEEFDAWRKEMGLTLDYYAYNPGEVINNKAAGILTRGFNLYNPNTGKAFLPGPYSDYPHEYEICGTFSSISFTDINGNTSVPTLTDGKFFNVDAPGELTVVGGNNTDTLVHLVWSGWRNEGEPDYTFEPYWENTLNLNLTQLTGKLNGAGNSVVVFPNGLAKIGDVQDEIVGNKAIKRIGVVDMGTLNWIRTLNSGAYFLNAPVSDMAQPSTQADRVKGLICSKYPVDTVITVNSSCTDKTIRRYDQRIYVRDDAYTDASTFDTAVTGTLLYYELATPQEYILDTNPDWNYRVDDFGTEQVVPSYDPSNLTAPISYDVQYAMNAVDAIRRLPDNYVERTDVKQTIGQSEKHVLSQKGVDANYAKKVGVENDLVVGAAKALAGNQRQEKEFSTMVMDGADGIAKINEAMGKSLVWNQLIQNGDFSDDANGWSGCTVENGVATRTSTDVIRPTGRPQIVSGHKYLLLCDMKRSGETAMVFYFGGGNTGEYLYQSFDSAPQNTWVTNSAIWISTYTGSATVQVRGGAGDQIKNFHIHDLTQMFGAGNEPATVEEFEKLFPLPYYAYNAGEIISNKTQSLGITGFNQWDEEWEVGQISSTTGQNLGQTDKIRSKNYIEILPSTYYNFCIGSGNFDNICFYDKSKQFISTQYGNGVKITPANSRYVRFSANTTYGTTYNHDICINLSDPNRNGTYEPYKHADLPLNLSTITGKLNGEGESVVIFPDGMRSAGTAYDSLLVDEDGYARKAVKRIGEVDMGTLEWARNEYSGINLFVAANAHTKGANAVCSLYTISDTAYYSAVNEKTFATGISSANVFVRDDSFSDAATFTTAMSGVMLNYELATYETYDLDEPIPMTFMGHHGGTITQTPQAPESAPMKMNYTMAVDALGTIQGLPQNYVSKESLQAMLAAMQSAGIFSGYTMTFNATTGKYEFTFTVSNS